MNSRDIVSYINGEDKTTRYIEDKIIRYIKDKIVEYIEDNATRRDMSNREVFA